MPSLRRVPSSRVQPQVVQERVMVSEGVQQVYEQPPQQSMQQQGMQQQSYQQPAYQQQQQQQQQQPDYRQQQQQQSPQRSLSGPAIIDTTDLRAFLMRCAARPPPRCTPAVSSQRRRRPQHRSTAALQ